MTANKNRLTDNGGVATGLYDSAFEHDSCGIALVVDVYGRKSHEIVENGLTALEHLAHRGATGAEEETGDGAGILVQMPHRFLRAQKELNITEREEGTYACGLVNLPRDESAAQKAIAGFEDLANEESLHVLGWRSVPTDPSSLGSSAADAMGTFWQVAVAYSGSDVMGAANGINGEKGTEQRLALDRMSFCLRKRAEHAIDGIYIPSLSCRTIVYKGMLTAHQLVDFYPDLSDERFESAIALVHSRFSTNTFPSWPLAHPYRYVAHNGEINTLTGNRNWMRARESLLASPLFPGDLKRVLPICTPGASDSASFDEALELLHLGGRSLPHAVLMMIPEAWEANEDMDPERRAFYRYHASIVEPWDGPAAIIFTDGTVAGGVLDRNGFRPSRWLLTSDGMVVLGSETGVLDIEPSRVLRKGRLQPGRMFLVDTSQGRIIEDAEIKAEMASAKPYRQWLESEQVYLRDLPSRKMLTPQHSSVVLHQQLFGYTNEDLKMIISPMTVGGQEPIGSMGNDASIAVLSNRPRLLYDYFTQLFAQVTNPPLDAIREEMVTATRTRIGTEGNMLDPQASSCKQIILDYPVIDNEELAKLMYVNEHGETPSFKAFAIDGLFDPSGGVKSMAAAIEDVRSRVSAAIANGANAIILSDRNSNSTLAPIPMLLLVSSVHEHLVRERTRTRVGLIAETGEAREVHHMALLVSYGASAVNPYLAFETIDDMVATGLLKDITTRTARHNYVKACVKGIVKVMSKMGISTVASYIGAQVFEAVGLGREFVDEYFTGTTSRIGGVGLDVIMEEVAQRHRLAYHSSHIARAHRELETGGEYQWRREGERHLLGPRVVFKLQQAVRNRDYGIFKEYSRLVDNQAEELCTLRGLMTLKTGLLPQIPIEDVEPVSSIVRRFSTGAMSYGSISKDAHEAIAVAMNRLGAKSNTGEGGEDPERFTVLQNGDWKRSAIKQVASGRFGVTIEYLTNADDIQIKISQGAKPGEGGQLPGHKVYPWIARIRYSTPGVGLISPPPHHDIYSIEDIAQLIHDLKCANPDARIHVKLVAEVGVGTVAAGVAKAKSDVVLISGHDGGTGAAPLTSIKHAGIPWEMGLAETNQVLVANGLRDRIVVQVDGQLKTGRDVVIGALLGAEEFGFATMALVALGCVMMRVCHLDTCPVGIATQNPALRERFTGKPEYVVAFFEMIAEEVREYLVSLGLRSLEEAVGRTDLLDVERSVTHWKARGLDLSSILMAPQSGQPASRFACFTQNHGIDTQLDHQFMEECLAGIEAGTPVRSSLSISNVNRTVGTLLSHEIVKRYGPDSMPDDFLELTFNGSAGQSFGAFIPSGMTMRLVGDANDYLGKGLSGGRIVVVPPLESSFTAEEQIIVGNVLLYGATSGEAFIRGQAGERFCVRNSGATAVVEGVGDHGCEYMTGGKAVILGPVGRNFAAGMSGGVAYLYSPGQQSEANVNKEMVDLLPLEGEDIETLESLLSRYYEATGSTVASFILSAEPPRGWEAFTKVMPRDYARIIRISALAEGKGIPVEDAIMEAIRG
ncbi:MAG: glutamate synthase large subunit [Acidimicrobiales bacterium]